MSDRFQPPIFSPNGDVGEAEPGALLTFYVNGSSTTKKDIYSDIGLTTPHTNPVVADGEGRFAQIFANDIYSVKLTDADLNNIWGPFDDIAILSDGSFTVADAVNDGVTDVISATHSTTGTPAAGIGTGIALKTETADSNIETGARIASVSTDVTPTSEDFDMVGYLMTAGATAAEKWRSKSTGEFSIPTAGFYSINSVSVLTATALGSTVLASSLTSFGASPTFVTPLLGTPTSGNLANCTGLPAAGVVGTAAILGANTFTALQTFKAGADIASATAVDLTAATGNTVVITGTTTSTSLTMTAGQQMELLPSGAWPLTYHATTMNINGGVSYTCAAGDRIFATKDLAGVIRVSVIKQDGTALVAGGGATKEFFVNAVLPAYGSSLAAFTFASVPDTQIGRFNFNVPNDFTSLTEAVVLCLPNTTETIQWDLATNFGTDGELYTANTDSVTDDTLAVTINTLTDLDVSAGLTGIAADDYVGFNFVSNTSNIEVVGLRIKYS